MTKSNPLVSIAIAVTVATMATRANASEDSCGNYNNCAACASDSGCMWALLYNCSERCISTNYTDPGGFKAKNVIWRSAVTSAGACQGREECSVVSGILNDPSFEGLDSSPWAYTSSSKPVKTGSYSVSSSTSALDTALDGNYFLFMGRGNTMTTGQTYKARINNTRISPDVTHISFFYALPFLSRVFDRGMYYPFNSRSALSVFIDGKLVLHMCNKTLNAEYYAKETRRYYFPMNIDVRKFANGKTHTVELYFVEGKDPTETYCVGQGMIIDYFQFIKSNQNGNTVEGLNQNKLEYDEWVCSDYCKTSYIGDSTCDISCKLLKCNGDGGDCEYTDIKEEKSSGDDDGGGSGNVVSAVLIILLIIFAPAIVVIIVFVVIIVIRKKGLCRNCKGGDDEYDSTELEAHKNIDSNGWSISTGNILFGGKEAEMGVALKDTIVVYNNSEARTFTLKIDRDESQPEDIRYKIVMKPVKFQLDKGYEQTVNVFVKIFCTTTVNETVQIIASSTDSPGTVDTKIVKIAATGKQSTRIDPYDVAVGGAIGEGSFGIVYRGIYKKQHNVAIKRLKVIDENTINSFNKEADVLERVSSKYTVKFYGALVTDEYYCFLTEFIPYGALSGLIPRIVPLDHNGGKRVLCALNIAKALEYLHENNILHRDLKPDNVLVVTNIVGFSSDSVVCKLTDFGTSKVLHSKDEANMTKVVGTPIYMAPEVITTNTYGKESDIYSFGASFTELWTGKPPFSDIDLQYYTFIGKIASGELSLSFAPESTNVPCPQEITSLVNRCVDMDPGKRPAINEIVSTLDKAWASLRLSVTDPDLFH